MFNYDKSIKLNSFKRRKRFFMKFFLCVVDYKGNNNIAMMEENSSNDNIDFFKNQNK